MADVKWIKIVTDIFDDEKILLIETMPEADSIIVIWFKLLVLAGRQNNSGVFMFNDCMPYTDEMFSAIFRRKLATVKLALKTFEEFGMIKIINNAVTIPNWSKHQTLDQVEKKAEYMRNYMREKRKEQKQIAECKTNSKTNSKANVSCADKEIDKDIDRDKEKEIYKEKESKPKRFAPPTIEEVREYCAERGRGVDPEGFMSHYESNGWKVGKNPMKDWKAAVRTWERNNFGNSKQNADLDNEGYYTEEGYMKAVRAYTQNFELADAFHRLFTSTLDSGRKIKPEGLKKTFDHISAKENDTQRIVAVKQIASDIEHGRY